ncbi:MAG: ribonuclease Z [Chloroflexi bacterium]|jgi:ribonuclease Z|nr:ribonuclease Z [Anaerolineaceae bacterium]NMB90040.1 ribonuclease Z [Chloroflexota bacterium]
MGKIIILGSANAIPDEEHENASLFVQAGERNIMVDCGTSPVQRLQRLGLPLVEVTDLVLTHFHPDHISNAPLLLMDMWLLGRKTPLSIYGLAYTIERFKAMMELFEWKRWPDFYPVEFNVVADEDLQLLLDDSALRIFSSPVKHMIPTIGLRFEFSGPRKVVAYSCDTSPCPQVIDLARNADILIHEASGEYVGHSSAVQAAQAACQSGAGELYLIHYATEKGLGERLVEEAQRVFDGPVELARDLMEIKIQ